MTHAAFQSEALRIGPEDRFGDYTRAEALVAYGWMGRYVRAFLDAYLRGDAAALGFMQAKPGANGVPAHLLAVDLHHAEGDPPTLATLATLYARSGHRDVAAIYATMVKRAPAMKLDERSLIAWGEKFGDAGRTREAVDIYRLATALYPDSGRAAFYLAMGYERNRETALSITAWERVLVIWPGMAEATAAIARLQRQL